MIKYGATRAALAAAIEAHAKGWLDQADKRRDRLVAAGTFLKEKPIWSAVKQVYLLLQGYKCAFCERGLAVSGIEHDVEHFRPKNAVKGWPAGQSYPFATGGAHPGGYYWLAYDIENYAAACKDCNTLRKANFFPIAGGRGAAAADPRSLNATEQPLLFYPITDCDPDDPEELIVFDGFVAQPRHKAGRAYERARITIDFFQLNERDELLKERCRLIREIFLALGHRDSDKAHFRAAAESKLDELLSDDQSHASCGRCFLALAEQDYERARQIYQLAEQFLTARRKRLAGRRPSGAATRRV